jgi:hypothetical protein
MSKSQPAAALDASLLVRPPAGVADPAAEEAVARDAPTVALTLSPARHLQLRLLAARTRQSQRALLRSALDRYLVRAEGG